MYTGVALDIDCLGQEFEVAIGEGGNCSLVIRGPGKVQIESDRFQDILLGFQSYCNVVDCENALLPPAAVEGMDGASLDGKSSIPSALLRFRGRAIRCRKISSSKKYGRTTS